MVCGVTRDIGGTEKDPFLWLEEVEGERAMAWVHERNQETLADLEGDQRYGRFVEAAGQILNASDRIPYGSLRGGWVYNFWQDRKNVRGLFRRSTLDSYRTDNTDWEVVLDLDKLAREEGENWVYKGITWLSPVYDRCLLRLSRGGKDSSVYREFDTVNKTFVEGGFFIPEAKSGVAWIDRDTLLVGTDWGEGSRTRSGYPRVVKRWRRGKPLSKAEPVLEGLREDVGVWPRVMRLPESQVVVVERSLTFFTAAYFLLEDQSKPVRVPVPESADIQGYYAGRILVGLRETWKTQGESFPPGSLLAMPVKPLLGTGRLPTVETIFIPDDRTSVERVSVSASGLYLGLLQNVKGRVLRFQCDEASGTWSSRPLSLPATGAVSVSAASPFSETVFINYEDHITPDRLYEYDTDSNLLGVIKTLPERFDAGQLEVHQHEVNSADGETIPYFIVHRKGLVSDGRTPTLLYGYGGFEISLTPKYSAVTGRLWLERGGAYTVANIRGGGEFGPRWHKAALKQDRQRAYDDFLTVARDLIDRKITSPGKLGIMGGSNGGLLVGAAMTQAPELFGAVVCRVPLLDMLRYTRLLAGSSWIAEYGDPEDPAMRESLRKISPYHNLRKDRRYPRAFILTSTKDDRVHPGHARKMVARMREQGHPVYYYENTEGGHAAGANLRQHARRYALEYVYLSRLLGLE